MSGNDVFETIARTGKALGSGSRLKVLHLRRDEGFTAGVAEHGGVERAGDGPRPDHRTSS